MRRSGLRIGTVVLVGAVYCAAGVILGALAGQASSNELRFAWRLAAWVVSAVAFVAQIAYEHFRIGNPPRETAGDAAAAVALGAFGLAVAALVHGRSAAAARHFPTWALVVWPIVTAVPAFVAAFILAVLISRARRPA